MGSIELLCEQIDAGKMLIIQLTQDGFPIAAASWIKESDGGFWYLYLASPVLDGRGVGGGYQRIRETLKKMRLPFPLDTGDIKLLGASDSLAKAMAAVRDRESGGRGMWYNRGSLEMMPIDVAYIYPPVSILGRADVKHGVAEAKP
jgi:hypothetical protein